MSGTSCLIRDFVGRGGKKLAPPAPLSRSRNPSSSTFNFQARLIMIYGNISTTSWSLREIPPAGYSNAMNIARCDKRRADDEKNGEKKVERGCEKEREKERTTARARVKDTKEGFLVAYSVCKMSSQALYTPHPPSLAPRRMYRWFSHVDHSVPNRLSGVFKARRDNSI